MGEVEFFAVVTSYWAKKVGLKRVGEVQLLHPFEDDPIYAPSNVDTEEEFEDWVKLGLITNLFGLFIRTNYSQLKIK
jgi:hypothetical protein